MKWYIIKKGTRGWALKAKDPTARNVVEVPHYSTQSGFHVQRDVEYSEDDRVQVHAYDSDHYVFCMPPNPLAPFFAVSCNDVIVEER